jgi:2-dehydropantoate 2-reductase
VNGTPLEIELCLPGDPEPADLVVFAVKYYQLAEAIEGIRSCVGRDTVILSLLNGIDSESIIRRELNTGHVLFSTVVGIDVNRTGDDVRLNKMGEIFFGEKTNDSYSDSVLRVEALFRSAEIPYQIPRDMEKLLWWKLMINAGMNQVSTVRQQTYGEFRRDPVSMGLMIEVQKEVIAVAGKLGIQLGEQDLDLWMDQLMGLCEQGRSSMLQDYWTGRKMEIDAFGGYICRIGKELAVSTPFNAQIVEQIRKMEDEKGIRS